MAKLHRIIFDAVPLRETEKGGVVYFRANDKAGKETIVRRNQIVQEFEIGESDAKAEAEARIKSLRGKAQYNRRCYDYYSAPGNNSQHLNPQTFLTRAIQAEDEIHELEQVAANYDAQNERIENEFFEWCIMDSIDNVIHRGPMSRAKAIAWMEEWEQMTKPNSVFYIARRPVGVWEKYDG